MRKIFLGSDHAGYQYKNRIKEYLVAQGEEVIDLGAFNEESIDYPDIAQEVGEKIRENSGAMGVLVCGSGIGVSIAANKMAGVRAALCHNDYTAQMAREHNDANVLALGSRVIDEAVALSAVDTFLKTPFSNEERHIKRVQKLNQVCQ
jgi:ribose 5-phosphate isomerase B